MGKSLFKVNTNTNLILVYHTNKSSPDLISVMQADKPNLSTLQNILAEDLNVAVTADEVIRKFFCCY